MNRIDRYISGLFWRFFLGGIVIFATIFVAIDALGLMVEYRSLAGDILLRYYAYSIPEVIYRMVPVACVMAVVFTLSTLNKGNELVALYSSGMSLTRICIPMLIWVLLLCGFEFALSDRILPNFAKNKNYIFYHQIKKSPSLYAMTKTNKIWYRSKDTIFYIKTLNEKTHKAQGLTLYYFNDVWDLMQMISAKEVDLLGEKWHLKNGTVTLFTQDSSFPITSQFREKTITMGEDAKDLTSTAHTSDSLSIEELRKFVQKNKEAGLDTIRYEVNYHSKFSYAFAALVMAMLGIPFSVTRGRSGGVMRNASICIALVFLFWIFYSSSLTLGNYGHLPPVIAAWLPIVVMSWFAYYLIKRVRL